ncbi:Signal transduction histidine-protein kinase BaeS [Calidithermus terrae]|uniref:histidine kinase n=1 Tax=Calidithermus terrae TaxID=1408545 RepID=A0A399EGS6_9DEIN|nr:ATP-binding protein [Calidithermus terrae]RIH82783.1 Signal transduction histidine-protein kinase BaeS [Calidithermus terrae]
MKLWDRLEVRLALLMAAVAVATNLITFGLTAYQGQKEFRYLPASVRAVLQDPDAVPLPFDLSKEINRQLLNADQVIVQLAPDVVQGERVVMLRALEGGNVLIAQQFTLRAPVPGVSRREAGFLARLQQSLTWATLASVGLGILMAFVFARRLARPLEAISQGANRLARGELAVRIPAPRSNDEVSLLARNFNAMAESLERLEKERRAMIADIAHELRTPLTVLQGRLEAIQDGVIRLDEAEVARLHHQTRLLARLVEDLRTLSLVDAGRLTLERQPLELREVLASATQSFRTRAEARGVGLELDLPHQPIALSADPDRLAQVVGNLLANALDHAPPRGRVTVAAGQEDGKAWFSVADTGPGIPEEALPKIFDRFYRVEQSRNRQTGGTGLGLSIVRALVELHGGRVSACNRPEGGAVFRVELPVAPKGVEGRGAVR